MKTKYILHGGFQRGEDTDERGAFYAEILKDAPVSPRILLVCFAKDEERVPQATARVIEEFNKHKGQRNLSFDIANEVNFIDQIKLADIIYFHGGTTIKLLNTLKKFPPLHDLFNNKIIAGESAGANVLATYCYSPNADAVLDCLGILPVKIIPHYCEEYKGKFDTVGEELKPLYLPEYTFEVMKVSHSLEV